MRTSGGSIFIYQVSPLPSYRGGMIFTSLIAFILPIILTLHVNKISDNKGSVAVYFGFSKENGAELLSLRILLFCAVSAILVAVIGNFV